MRNQEFIKYLENEIDEYFGDLVTVWAMKQALIKYKELHPETKPNPASSAANIDCEQDALDWQNSHPYDFTNTPNFYSPKIFFQKLFCFSKLFTIFTI